MNYEERIFDRALRKGRSETLLKLLRLRFGELPDDVVARVHSADDAHLDRWTERILTAPTLAGVLRDP